MLDVLLHLTTLFTAGNSNNPEQDDVVKINYFKQNNLNVRIKHSFENNGDNSPDCFGVKMNDGKTKWLKVAYDWSLPKDTIIEKSSRFFKLKKECKVIPTNCTFYVNGNFKRMIFKNTSGKTFKMKCDEKNFNLNKNMGIALNAAGLPDMKLLMEDGKFFTDKMVFIDSWSMWVVDEEKKLKFKAVSFVSNAKNFFEKVVESTDQLFCITPGRLDAFLNDNSKDMESTIMLTYGYEDTVQLLENPDFDVCDVNTIKDLKTKKEKEVEAPFKKFYDDDHFLHFLEEFSIESVVDEIIFDQWNTLPRLKYLYDSVKNDTNIDDQKKKQLWQFAVLFDKFDKQKALDLLENNFDEQKNNYLERNYGRLIEPKDVNLDHIKDFINGIDLEEIKNKRTKEEYVDILKLQCFLREINNYLEHLKNKNIDVQMVETVLKTKTEEMATVFYETWKILVQESFDIKMKDYIDSIDAYKKNPSELQLDIIEQNFESIKNYFDFYKKHGIARIEDFEKTREEFEGYLEVVAINKMENIADSSKGIIKEIDDELRNKTGEGLNVIFARYELIMIRQEKCKKYNAFFDQDTYDSLVSKGQAFDDYRKEKMERESKEAQEKALRDKAAQLARDKAAKDAEEAKKTGDKDKAAKDMSGTEKKDATKDDESETEKMSTGWIVGIVFIVLAVVCVAAAVGWFIWKKNISKEVIAVGEKKRRRYEKK